MMKTTPLSNVFELYSERVFNGLRSSELKFLIDGERIEPGLTPMMLDVGDEEQIDVMFEKRNYPVVIADCKWSNGDSYDGEYVEGRKEGVGQFRSANGDTYEGAPHRFLTSQLSVA